MKENKYDDDVFFQKYSEMDRSRRGLAGAAEWPTFQELMPDFSGKRVLDLGCGYGWHCRYASEKGASFVLGTDLSKRMLETAIHYGGKNIQYQKIAMEELELESSSFDIILSSLAFHYIEDFPAMVRKIYRWLTPGGDFVFSAEHPVFTAYGSQDWYYDEDGTILHFPVDRYFCQGKREARFLGEPVVKYHRTLTTYLNTLLQEGFHLKAFIEPQPPISMLDLPGMRDELRRPMMLLVAARKKKAGGE